MQGQGLARAGRPWSATSGGAWPGSRPTRRATSTGPKSRLALAQQVEARLRDPPAHVLAAPAGPDPLARRAARVVLTCGAKRDIASTLGPAWTAALVLARLARPRRRPRRRGRRCPATATPTWPSSAPGSPGCGPRTRCCGPTRRCGWSCSSARSPGSARRAATAAGASATTAGPSARSSAPAAPGSVEAMAREMHRSVDEVGAVVGRGRHRLRLPQGRRDLLRRQRAASCAALRHHHAELRAVRPRRRLDAPRRRQAAGDRPRRRHPRRALHPARRHRAPGPPGPGPRGRGRAPRRGRSTSGRPSARSTTARARTDHGTVRAEVVVRATEAYTGSIEGHEREVAAARQLHGRHRADRRRHLGDDRPRRPRAVRAERRDARLRPAHRRRPHRLGRARRRRRGGAAASRPRRCSDPRIADRLRRALVGLFPALDGIGVTHHWGGVLGVPRDLLPGVGFDRAARASRGPAATPARAWPPPTPPAAASADLIRGVDSDLTRLPWVGHRSRRWEPEPLRWLGVHATTAHARATDFIDRRRK